MKDNLLVPESMVPIFEEIVVLTNTFCLEHLDQDYAELSVKMAAALASKEPSPLLKGTPKSWACSIIYALGKVNFLFAPDRKPRMKATDLCKLCGVSASGASAKANQIFDELDIFPLHPDWSVPSMMENNPMVWMLVVNGMPADIRTMPREVQEIAFNQGLIPYIPADRKSQEGGE